MNLKNLTTKDKLQNQSSEVPTDEENDKMLMEVAQEVADREGEKQRIRLEKEAEQEKLLSKKLTNQNRTNH